MSFYYRKRGFGGYGEYGYSRPRKRTDPAKFEKAYEMRHNPTRAEAAMWEILRKQVYRNFPNHIFHRQYVQYGYILDFYCPTLRLGIEVDGSIHDSQKEYDWNRDNVLARHKIEIQRYTNDEVLYNPNETESRIYQLLQTKSTQTQAAKIGCFIATAAFGTPMAQEINILRRFRNLKMEPNLVGRCFVHVYYNLSPPLAEVISKSNNMKAFVRLTLKPIIRFLDKQINNSQKGNTRAQEVKSKT